MKNTEGPDYRKIFEDILEVKFPHKKQVCNRILKKKELSYLDIIKLNNLIFENEKNSFGVNQQYRAYNSDTILEILDYQARNGLSNSELAVHFQLSKNTLTKWKKYINTCNNSNLS